MVQNLKMTRVLITACILTFAVASAIFFPVAKLAIGKARADRLSAIYSHGLRACGLGTDEFDQLVSTHLPEKAATRITRWPAFSERAQVIAIGSEHLYYIEFDPAYRHEKKALTLNIKGIPKISMSEISVRTSQELVKLLLGDTHNAPKDAPMNSIDGAGYEFKAIDGVCAVTNSPDPGSRAGKLLDLYTLLVEHVGLKTSNDLQKSDDAIFSAASALIVE